MRVIYACDVGSTRKSRRNGILGTGFGWARISPEEPGVVRVSQDIEQLVTEIGHDIQDGNSVALGFEAPLFIPVHICAENLSTGRQGDKDRAFSAPVGLAVATLAVHQAAWILSELRPTCMGRCALTTDWKVWRPSSERQVLLCWEAFVSGTAHSDSHERDAATAANAFLVDEDRLDQANAVTAERPLSLIGAVALWSGWTYDLAILHRPTLVIKPIQSYQGRLERDDRSTCANAPGPLLPALLT